MPNPVYVIFQAGIDANTAQQLSATCCQLANNGHDEIHLLLSTPGGNVNAGLTLYNVLRALPAKVVTHNIGNVDSVGNAVFLAADERYACKHSTFTFHGVSIPANGPQEEPQARQLLDDILAVQDRIGSILRDRTKLSADAVRELFREARSKDAATALTDGLVQRVQDVAIPKGTPVITLTFPV